MEGRGLSALGLFVLYHMKLFCLIAMGLILTGCTTTNRGFPPDHQIVNFDKVDERVYRGAQPNHNGLDYLKSLGVKSVINLRDDAVPFEPEIVRSMGMFYCPMPLSGTRTMTHEEINNILTAIATLPQPVFIHCQFGCDRTGTVIACYRKRVYRWSGEHAVKEAEAYGISPLLPNFKQFIRDFPVVNGK